MLQFPSEGGAVPRVSLEEGASSTSIVCMSSADSADMARFISSVDISVQQEDPTEGQPTERLGRASEGVGGDAVGQAWGREVPLRVEVTADREEAGSTHALSIIFDLKNN